MSRLRLNQEYRNKIANRLRVHLEQENTQEKEKFFQERESFLDKQNATWKLAQQCVTRQYPKKDVDMAHYLQDKYPNVNTIAKDSCFHFGYMKQKVDDKTGEDLDEDDRYEKKHFDFRLNGDIDGVDRQDDMDSYNPRSRDFAYAYFRDELKGKVNKGEKCNPDINIEQKWGKGDGEENASNPHWTQVDHANERELGLSGGRENQTCYAREWNGDYELDLIGREYCRDRQIGCDQKEFAILMTWQQAKSKLIMAHTKWVETILEQCKLLKNVLRDHTYLEQSIELANKMGITLNESNILGDYIKGNCSFKSRCIKSFNNSQKQDTNKRSKNLGTSNIRPTTSQITIRKRCCINATPLFFFFLTLVSYGNFN